MATPPVNFAPAQGVGAFFVDGECLVFSEAAQRAFSYNTTAGVIWCLMEEGLSAPEISAQLVRLYDLPEEVALTFSREALTQWLELGLVATEASAVSLNAPAASLPMLPPRESGSRRLWAREHHYRLNGAVFHLRFNNARQARLITSTLDHLSTPASESSSVVIDVVSEPFETHVYLNGSLNAKCSTDSELAPIIKGLVWAEAVNRSDFLFGFHAGVVAGASGVLIMPGKSGSGKSTLTACLIAAGLDYLSDEMALLDSESFDVLPLPLALCVKDSGLDVLTPFFPLLKTLPIHDRADGKRVIYMPPPLPVAASRSVKVIVFPTYSSGAQLRLNPITSGETVCRLLTECLVAGKDLKLAHIRQLIEWVEGVQHHTLTFGSAPEAAALLKALLRQ